MRWGPVGAVMLGAGFVRLTGEAVAQEPRPVNLPRITGPIVLDGVIDEEAWQEIAPLSLTMYLPTFGGRPTERTEIRVAYDSEYLYASGRFCDSDPGGIRTNSLQRDRSSADDEFAIFVDSFNDNQSSLWFATNPAGVRIDRTISGNGADVNESWDTYWDVATTVTDEGWFAEIRIPFSSLRFQPRDGRVVMGLTATRLIARKNERVTFPAIDPQVSFRQPSAARDVGLEGVTARRPVYVTPYLLTGIDRTNALPDGAGFFDATSDLSREFGVDVKYNLTDNLTFDGSVNTDFAQVEADDQQINLTRFPLFFPEKRQFFQERSGVFSFDMGSGGRLFHSRNIGLSEDRNPVRILGGGRLVGRVGEFDVGALNMQAEGSDGIPSENFGVLRLRRATFNESSYTGAMVTSRLGDDGSYNVGLGLDAFVHLFGNDYVTVRTAQAFDEALSGYGFVDQSQFYGSWERRADEGLRYSASFNRVGRDYAPDLGFLNRRDFSQVTFYTEYNRVQTDESWLRTFGPGFIGIAFYRNDDNSLESLDLAHWWGYATKSGATGWFELEYFHEDVRDPFPLGGDVGIPAGSYDFGQLWVNYRSAPGHLVRTMADLQVGSYYDGWRGQLIVTPTWNVSRHLELSSEYELNVIRFPDRASSLTTHLARFRVRTAVNARLSGTAFVQYNSLAALIGVDLRIRYNFREGNDLWLVYDEGFNSDRTAADPGRPRLPLSQARTLRLKFTYTFLP